MKAAAYIKYLLICVFVFLIQFKECKSQPTTPSILSVQIVPSADNPGRVKIISNEPEPDIWQFKFLKRYYHSEGFNDIEFPEQDPFTEYSYQFDEDGEAHLKSETYRVQVYVKNDEGQPVVSLMSIAVSTIYLEPLDFDTCTQSISLHWNPYVGGDGSPIDYKIMRKADNLTYEVMHTTADTLYRDERIPPGYNYSYYIEVGSDSLKSNSNVREQQVDLPSMPNSALQYLYYAEVMGYGEGDGVEIISKIDTSVDLKNYALFGSDALYGDYTLVQEQQKGESDSIVFYETAQTPQPFYRMQSLGICDFYVDTTNVVQPITLAIDQKDEDVTLNWHISYAAEMGEEYILQTVIDGTPSDDQSISSGTFEMVLDLNVVGGDRSEIFEFRIIAKSDKGYVSLSNVVMASRLPIVTLPNAFTPNNDGVNDRIGPFNKPGTGSNYAYFKNADVNSFTDFEMVIYDRYGGIVFEATDISRYWDGTKGSYPLNEGAYPYAMKFTTSLGRTVEQNGMFQLVYP